MNDPKKKDVVDALVYFRRMVRRATLADPIDAERWQEKETKAAEKLVILLGFSPLSAKQTERLRKET
jgi:hypothetical protein